nr:DnaJ homolog subfamily C member 7 homolog [Ipomoea batatas]
MTECYLQSFNYHYQKKRLRRFNAKQTLLRNVSAFAEDFFQNLHHESDEHDSSSSQGSSWFQRDFRSYAPNSSRSRNKGHRKWRRFDFTEDLDFEVESFFRTGFGGNYYYTWFVNEDPQQRRSSRYSNNYRHSKWRFRDEEDYDDESTESDMYESDLKSERLALGLNPSGPLNLEDVKNAYRSCALKWHPDRHHGPSKVFSGFYDLLSVFPFHINTFSCESINKNKTSPCLSTISESRLILVM